MERKGAAACHSMTTAGIVEKHGADTGHDCRKSGVLDFSTVLQGLNTTFFPHSKNRCKSVF